MREREREALKQGEKKEGCKSKREREREREREAGKGRVTKTEKKDRLTQTCRSEWWYNQK